MRPYVQTLGALAGVKSSKKKYICLARELDQNQKKQNPFMWGRQFGKKALSLRLVANLPFQLPGVSPDSQEHPWRQTFDVEDASNWKPPVFQPREVKKPAREAHAEGLRSRFLVSSIILCWKGVLVSLRHYLWVLKTNKQTKTDWLSYAGLLMLVCPTLYFRVKLVRAHRTQSSQLLAVEGLQALEGGSLSWGGACCQNGAGGSLRGSLGNRPFCLNTWLTSINNVALNIPFTQCI